MNGSRVIGNFVELVLSKDSVVDTDLLFSSDNLLWLIPLTTTSMSRSDPGQISSWATDPQIPNAITSFLALSLSSSLSSTPRQGEGSFIGSKRRILDNSKSPCPYHSHPFANQSFPFPGSTVITTITRI